MALGFWVIGIYSLVQTISHHVVQRGAIRIRVRDVPKPVTELAARSADEMVPFAIAHVGPRGVHEEARQGPHRPACVVPGAEVQEVVAGVTGVHWMNPPSASPSALSIPAEGDLTGPALQRVSWPPEPTRV